MKMPKFFAVLIALFLVTLSLAALTLPAFAAELPEETGEAIAASAEDQTRSAKAVAAAIAVAITAAAGAIGMGIAIGKSAEGMSRQPEAAGKINSAMMLGLVFIETAIIYALIIAILIIFVL